MTEERLPAEDPYPAEVDLTSCDREPIHVIGAVQDFSCLIALSPDWLVTHASANVAGMLGLDPGAIIGTPIAEHLPAKSLHKMRAHMALVTRGEETVRLFGLDAMGDGRRFDVAFSLMGRSAIVEFERAHPRNDTDTLATVQPMIARSARQTKFERMCHEAARGLQAITGYDRVMIYRFEPDETGTVIAEAARFGMEPYLGLRYPASDIPRQARALYLRNRLRIVADIDGPVHPILPERPIDGRPLDLSLAIGRAISPIHLEYLRNMGVASSMSVSIIIQGRLWGLFACHHPVPHLVDYRRRTAAELFGQLFGYELASRLAAEQEEQAAHGRVLHDSLTARLSSGADLRVRLEETAAEIEEAISFDGIGLWMDGGYRSLGLAPDGEEFEGLVKFLNTSPVPAVYASDAISSVYPPAEAFADRAAGMLALPISRSPRDYLILFRKELVRDVRWAGNPEKPVRTGPNGLRLTPRRSFEAWREVVRGRSAPWTPGEVAAAEALRVTMLEVVLKLTDEARSAAKKAGERQEILVAELNHRVRNILNLIRGLVGQSSRGASSVTEFSTALNGRIQALSRAHDLLTADAWGPADLAELIRIEAEAYIGEGGERLTIDGPRVLLEPGAVTTMALVLHELVTNSAKYGALSAPAGRVRVRLSPAPEGDLRLEWRESGGPAVGDPSRRGFGTAIIERSIPHELKGDAEIDFRVTGLEARFRLPAAVIASQSGEAAALAADSPEMGRFSLEGKVALVLEDNLIISLDAVDHLEDLGAQSVIAVAAVSQAMTAIAEAGRIDVAILDVNLGDETSMAVAQELARRGVPFVLATGYGGQQSIVEDFPEAPLVTKPYDAQSLTYGLLQALGRQGR